MHTRLRSLLAVLTAFALVSVALPLHAGIIETFDFETGGLSQLGSTEKDGPTASVTASTVVARDGQYAMRSYLGNGDKRAEGVSSSRGTVGGENWYAWSIYAPSDYPGDGLYDIVSQFHDWHRNQPSWGQDGTAPTCFLFVNGIIQLDLKWQSAPQTPAHTSFNLGPYTKGTWHDFVVHVKWSHDASVGFMKVWINGDLKLDYTGSTYLDYGAGNGPYFKMGNYKGTYNWPGTKPRIFYMDAYRMGDAYSSYEEVSPPLTGLVAYEGFDYAPGSIDGADGGAGWSTTWVASGGAGSTSAITDGFTYTDLPTKGNRLRVYDTDGAFQTISRSLDIPLGTQEETYWIAFLAKKNHSGREGYIHFGGLRFRAYQSSNWQVKTPGTSYTTLTGATYNATHLFLARVDATTSGDTVRVWVDPDLSAGEPAVGTELVSLTDSSGFVVDFVTIQHGPWGNSSQSSDWDEIRLATNFTALASILPSYALETDADVFAQAGIHANTNHGSATLLRVKDDSNPDWTRQAFLRFDLAAYSGTIDEATLVLTPDVVGGDNASSTFHVLLVANDTWQEGTLTWNNKPAGSTLLGVIDGASVHAGQEVTVDITAAAQQEQAGDGTLSIVLVSQVQGAQRYIFFHSHEATEGQPYLRIK